MTLYKFAIPLLLILVSAYSASAILSDGLVACLDAEGDLEDATVNNHDGSWSGAARFNTTIYKIGTQAITLDGNNYINWGSGWTVPSTAFTFNVWVYDTSQYGSDGARSPLLYRTTAGGTANPYALNIIDSSGGDVTYMLVGDGAGQSALVSASPLGYSQNAWHMITFTKNGTDYAIYVNGTLKFTFSNAQAVADDDTKSLLLGYRSDGGHGYRKGLLDTPAIWNRNLSADEIVQLYNSNSGLPCSLTGNSYFSITAKNRHNDSNLLIFNATIDGVVWPTTNGTISTNINSTSYRLHNITIQAYGYYDYNETNYNASSNLNAGMTPYYGFNVSYSGNINKYVRDLSYSFNITCPSFTSTNISRYINNVLNSTASIPCTNATQTITSSFRSSENGNYKIHFVLNTSFYSNIYNMPDKNPHNYTSDVTAPVIDLLNLSFGSGFTVQPNITVTFRCNDTYENLTYNVTFNGAGLFNAVVGVNATATNITLMADGTNIARASCADYWNTTNASVTISTNIKKILLINEITGLPFNVANLTSAIVLFDDNSSYYDFKAASRSNITALSASGSKLRIELGYPDATIITRYIDTGFTSDDDISVCANTDDITHYEQLIVSAIQRGAVMKNLYTRCYIAMDYTRFAYQNSYVLKAFTINKPYYLYTYDSGQQVLLSSVDGSIQTYINLDTLEFNAAGYGINIYTDSITVEKTDTDQVMIYYKNLKGDNSDLSLVVTREDTDAVLLTFDEFNNSNEFTYYFDYSTFPDINSTTLFKAVLTKTSNTGTTSIITRYFDGNGNTGVLDSKIGFVIALLMSIFGLTFATVRVTFGWFGAIMTLISIGILGFTMAAWYVTLLMYVEFIVLVYIILLMSKIGENSRTVA